MVVLRPWCLSKGMSQMQLALQIHRILHKLSEQPSARQAISVLRVVIPHLIVMCDCVSFCLVVRFEGEIHQYTTASVHAFDISSTPIAMEIFDIA